MLLRKFHELYGIKCETEHVDSQYTVDCSLLLWPYLFIYLLSAAYFTSPAAQHYYLMAPDKRGLQSIRKDSYSLIWDTRQDYSLKCSTSKCTVQWTLELRPAWHTNNLGYYQNFRFDLRPKSWVTTRMPVKTTWVTTRMAFVSFSLSPDTRVCGRNSGQCIALYN
jgi:hypothetical protein